MPRDPLEAVLTRLEQDPFQQQAVGRLLLSSLGDRDPGGAHALDEVVAHPLELLEVEQPGLGVGAHGERQPAHRERGYECIGKLAFELGDLAS